MAIDRAFPVFAAAVREAGVPLTVLSDGLDYSIRRILANNGLGDLPVVANRLVAEGERGWRLEFPYSSPDCRSGNCKCASAGSAHADRRRVLVIGDGASDFCVSGEADLVFAKHRLIEHCAPRAFPTCRSRASPMRSTCCRRCSRANSPRTARSRRCPRCRRPDAKPLPTPALHASAFSFETSDPPIARDRSTSGAASLNTDQSQNPSSPASTRIAAANCSAPRAS
jgi:hypothetical protein